MKKISDFKILHRDKYGILRGTALLCLLIVFAMGLNMYLHDNRDTLTAEERANDAARQVAAQFQQMIEDSISQMRVAADFLAEGTEEEAAIFALARNAMFSASAIFEEDAIVCAYGEINQQDDQKKTTEFNYRDIHAHIIAQDDDSIQVQIPLRDGRKLAAWIAPDRVKQVLSRAYADDYGYAVFNDETGIYLINHTHFTEHGYYDALLERNDSGDAEDLLNNTHAQAYMDGDKTAEEAYYIAQMPTEIDRWNIALLIPAHLINFYEGMPRSLYFIGMMTIAICVAAVALMSVYVCRKIRQVNTKIQKENRLLNQLTDLAVMHGQVAIFRYKRREDVFDHYVDGVNRSRSSDCCRGIASLAETCGFDSGEADRLRLCCVEMAPGTENEISIHSHVNGSERFLRVFLRCCADDANVILGCVQDCTLGMLSQNRIEDERNFFSSMKAKSSSVWQIKVGQNRWRIRHCVDNSIMDRLGIHDRGERDYENDLNNALRRYLHPEDYPSYAEQMSVNGIMNMYRKGKTEIVHEYRTMNRKKSGFEWHRQVVRVFQDPQTREIMANIFVLNVDAEKNAEMERRERSRMLQRSLTALGGLYRALFYVDLDNNICYTTKAPGGELISKHQSSFRETFDHFIDQTVVAEDRKALKDLTSTYLLRKNLTEANHNLCREYTRISGDNLKRTVMIVQAARFENGTVRDVVIALRNLE